jgi:hypothetical protein
MRQLFAMLVIMASAIGMATIENPQLEAQILQHYVVGAYEHVVQYTQENPKQLTGYGLTAFISSVIWLTMMRVIRSSDKSIDTLKTTLAINKAETKENPTVERAKNRALYNQLCQDRIILIGREKWLPDEISKARKELVDAKIQEESAESALCKAERRRQESEKKLDELINEHNKQNKEIACIDQEIERLKDLI